MTSSIKTNTPIKISTPSISYDVTIYNLVNSPVINNSNTNTRADILQRANQRI